MSLHGSPLQQCFKFIQRTSYTFVNTQYGVIICVLGGFIVLYSILQVFHAMVQPGPYESPMCKHCCRNDFADNLVGINYEADLSSAPIDVVYTWVNGSDERLIEQIARYRPPLCAPGCEDSMLGNKNCDKECNILACKFDRDDCHNSTFNSGNVTSMEHVYNQTNLSLNDSRFIIANISGNSSFLSDMNRYRDNSELKYSLRSLFKYAPWVRHIYIVTNGQIPSWLNFQHDRITIVSHSDIFPNKSHLPTFASPSIESHLHRIPNLSDKFLYFNDDVMLEDFYTKGEGQRFFPSWVVPACANGCNENHLGDGYCDKSCNVTECAFDLGDCVNGTSSNSRYNSWNNGQASGSSGKTQCSAGCPNNWIGDKVCDRTCKNLNCGFDGGDCGGDILIDNKVLELDPTVSTHDISFETLSFYMNFTNHGRIVSASHSNDGFIRMAIVTQKIKTLVVTLYQDVDTEHCSSSHCIAYFNVTAITSNEIPVIFHFSISRNHSEPRNVTEVLSSEPASTIAPTPSLQELEQSRRLFYEIFGVPSPTLPYITMQPDVTLQDKVPTSRHLLSTDLNENNAYTFTSKIVNLTFQATFKRISVSENTGESLESLVRKIVSVESVFDGDNLIPKADYNSEDEHLSNWIENSKVKQLELALSKEIDSFLANITEMHQVLTNSNAWPWEINLVLVVPSSKQSKSFILRRLMEDHFADSLKYVNILYTTVFGREPRKVPAHMPHMIDKHVMTELQAQWPDRFDATSSHRFRNSKDMQYGFSYFYYLMNVKKPFNLTSFLSEEIDLDGSKTISLRELSLLMQYVHPIDKVKVKDAEVEQMAMVLRNLTVLYDLKNAMPLFPSVYDTEFVDYSSVPITSQSIFLHQEFYQKIKKFAEKKKKYKTEVRNHEEIEFYMVGDNATIVENYLSQVRTRKKKFICLNDDIKNKNPDPRLFYAIGEFYKSYFPLPSPLEHPEGVYNAYLHMEDYKLNVLYSPNLFWFKLAIVSVLSLALIGILYWKTDFFKFCGKIVSSSDHSKKMVV